MGLYLRFFNEGERLEEELPALGPLEHVVVRAHVLLAERGPVDPSAEFAGGAGLAEAEGEFKRAMGTEPGGTQRQQMRFEADDGVFLRFLSFAQLNEPRPLPELGPYRVVIIGPRGVEADGVLLAVDSGKSFTRWQLNPDATKRRKTSRPDLALRAGSTDYYPGIAGARSIIAPASAAPAEDELELEEAEEAVEAPVAVAAPETSEPAAPAEAQPAPLPPAIDAPVVTAAPPEERAPVMSWEDVLAAALRLRVAIVVGIALVAVIVSVGPLRTALTPRAAPAKRLVAIGTELYGGRWSYRVASVQRALTAGSARPQEVFWVVQIDVTNRDGSGAQLSAGTFTLVDAQGRRYDALPPTNAAYRGRSNPESPFEWTLTFVPERSTSTMVIFDADAFMRSPQFGIADVPDIRVRLD